MKARTIIGWIFSVLASPMFLYAAFLKLTSSPMEIQGFKSFGLPIWFMYVIGVIEVSGVGFLLLSKRPWIGAALLCMVGLGAGFEHITHGQLKMAPIPLALAAFAVIGAFLRQGSPCSMMCRAK